MSLVGPRPALAWEADLYEARRHRRFEVKPGITGLWQVRGRNELSMREALELDVSTSSAAALRWTFGSWQ
jgi:lipopolysaccharide/colanic/teichoic acid biosynthesis glycosyltransferase